ncbi:large ribosomal subunit protein mL46 [Diutina catenulata]
MMHRVVARGYASAAASKKISSTLVLSRTPVVTADLPAFESQYYKYQNELWRRLMWTFPKWFYFRDGTLAAQKFKELNKDPVDNNPDIEYPRGRPEIRQNRDRRFKQEVNVPKTYDADSTSTNKDDLSRKIVPNSRTTEADATNNLQSLERKLARTLYLMVKTPQGWEFPSFPQPQGAPVALDVVAEQGLYEIGGDKINYFGVSNTPMHVRSPDESTKQYFIKSHIVSGDFVPQKGVAHAWLTKDEVKEHAPEYYAEIAHLLSDV